MRGVFIVAKVAISRASYSFDALYSYSVPEELAQKVKSGVRVLVPFGRGNRRAVGFVARTYTEAEACYFSGGWGKPCHRGNDEDNNVAERKHFLHLL